MDQHKFDTKQRPLFVSFTIPVAKMEGQYDEVAWFIDEFVEGYVEDEWLERGLRNKERGQRTYPPKALLKVVLLAYVNGRGSTRLMEEMVKYDVRSRIYMRGMEVDHTTIWRFIKRVGSEVIREIFKGLVMAMWEAGIVEFGRMTHDGTKVEKGNASMRRNVREEDIKKVEEEIEAFYEAVRKGEVEEGLLGERRRAKHRRKMQEIGQNLRLAMEMKKREEELEGMGEEEKGKKKGKEEG